MAARTNSLAVIGVLGGNYDADAKPNLSPFIATASAITDAVVSCAAKKSVTIGDSLAELIERWLACYYYARQDPTYKSRTTSGASGAFNTDLKDFANQAIQLDPSGCLNDIINMRRRPSVTWQGKPPSEQIDYADRN